MRKNTTVYLVLAFSIFSKTALAAITSISFSGPGGTGSDGITGGNLTEPRLDYSNVNFIDVTITFDSAGTYTVNEAPAFGDVANHTGQTWVGFNLQIQPGSLATFNPDWSGNAFSIITQTSTDITFSAGTVADGGHFDPFGTFNAPSAGTVVIRETPLGVPEPGPAGLFGLGALVTVLLGKRRA